MSEATFLHELEEIGALKEGHFLLASGRHSGQYVEKFDLLRQPRATERACASIVRLIEDVGPIELVVGPTTGGILLAFEVARQMDLPAAYAERAREGSSERAFKRGTTIEPGTRVLLVDDILTTGSSIRETLAALDRTGARVTAVAVLVDRSGGAAEFGVPLVSLARLNIATYPPDACPLCADRRPLTKPGTTQATSAAVN
jgi:orotate phosphoribosyltransferase